MPAKSKKQRRMMAIAEKHPEELYSRNKGAANMTHKQQHDFASTKEKGLPMKKQHSKPGNTDMMVSRESPSSNNKDRVLDTIEGMGTIHDTKEGTAEQYLSKGSTYTEVKGTNTSKVDYIPVKIGGKAPKEYDPD